MRPTQGTDENLETVIHADSPDAPERAKVRVSLMVTFPVREILAKVAARREQERMEAERLEREDRMQLEAHRRASEEEARKLLNNDDPAVDEPAHEV